MAGLFKFGDAARRSRQSPGRTRRASPVYGYREDGTPLGQMFIGPPGLAVEADGNILFSG